MSPGNQGGRRTIHQHMIVESRLFPYNRLAGQRHCKEKTASESRTDGLPPPLWAPSPFKIPRQDSPSRFLHSRYRWRLSSPSVSHSKLKREKVNDAFGWWDSYRIPIVPSSRMVKQE